MIQPIIDYLSDKNIGHQIYPDSVVFYGNEIRYIDERYYKLNTVTLDSYDIEYVYFVIDWWISKNNKRHQMNSTKELMDLYKVWKRVERIKNILK